MKRLAAGVGIFAAGFAVGWALRTRQTYVDMLRAVGAICLALTLAPGLAHTLQEILR